MKLIKKLDFSDYSEYFYENNYKKIIWRNKEINWFKILFKKELCYNSYSNENGAALQNCANCRINRCYLIKLNNKYKYKRHFILNFEQFFPKGFAEKTNHKICNICDDFCNQECFII